MQFQTTSFKLLAVSLFIGQIAAQTALLTNADGWATAAVRAQGGALFAAGFNLVLSAPAQDQSDAGSSSATPQPLKTPCQFDSCPAGSPAEGSDPTDGRLNFVNSFPVDAVRYGIQTVSPLYLNSTPDFVVSGTDAGNSVGKDVSKSGTIGAACEAAKEGIPSAAFSGASLTAVSFNTLTTSPNSSDTLSALLYGNLSTNLVSALVASPLRPLLPPGVTLNVNYARTTFSSSGAPDGKCASESDFKYVLTRIAPNERAQDVETCGSKHLPDEATVVKSGCYASVSVMNATTKADVDAATQGAVLARLKSLLSCFDC
ncbi:sure-like protein [Trametes punicea]|nr:sure-like protein [Trametes punicea]